MDSTPRHGRAALAAFAVLALVVVLVAAATDRTDGEAVTVALAPAPGGSDHPSITVTPSTELVDHQLVTVHGEGFDPRAAVNVYQCDGTANGDCASDFSEIEDDGSFTLQSAISFARCGDHPATCLEIGTFDQDVLVEERIGTVPIAFADDPQEVVPTPVTAAPLTGLADGDAIVLRADGMRPGDGIDALVCGSPEPLTEGCSAIPAGLADVVDDQGRLRFPVRATPVVGDGTERVDCRTQPCFLHVGPYEDPTTFALEFDPDAPLAPPPTASARLVEGDTLEVEGEGFVPTEEVYATTCIKRDGPKQCLIPTTVHETAGEDGTVTIAYEPESFDGFAGVEDCRGAECFVSVWGSALGGNDESIRAPFALDP